MSFSTETPGDNQPMPEQEHLSCQRRCQPLCSSVLCLSVENMPELLENDVQVIGGGWLSECVRGGFMWRYSAANCAVSKHTPVCRRVVLTYKCHPAPPRQRHSCVRCRSHFTVSSSILGMEGLLYIAGIFFISCWRSIVHSPPLQAAYLPRLCLFSSPSLEFDMTKISHSVTHSAVDFL